MRTEKLETILVVDDEPDVVRLVSRMLTGEGYSVLCAEGGHKALQLARDHGGSIELLLTDILMPHMDGRELACRFKAEYPGSRVLSMSGFSPGGDSLAEIPCLRKPFSREALTRTVREILAVPQARVASGR